MNEIFNSRLLNLQLLAEGTGGGDGGTSNGATGETGTAAVSQNKGVKTNPLADVKYGIQPEEAAQTTDVQKSAEEKPVAVDKKAEYDAFIKANKDLDDARIQTIVQNRLKSTKETVAKYEASLPLLEMLSQKYGVASSDVEALIKAIEDDNAYYEAEALEKGIPVEELKAIRKMERENSALKEQMRKRDEQDKADQLYSKWMHDAESTKTVYPKFDLKAEMQNSKFVDLLKSGIDVKTAYEVVHKDEIIPAAMKFAVDQTEVKMANNIIANKARPSENGSSAQSPAVTKRDVTALSKADRDEIERRVARGDKISFG